MPRRAAAPVLDPSDVLITPAKIGGSERRLAPDDELGDPEYDALFGDATRLFVPDQWLPDSRLLPSVEYVGTEAFGEVAETFVLNGDPEFSTKRLCTFEDLRIQSGRALIPLRPNVVQQKYLDLILPDWRERFAARSPLRMRGLREFILKPRKLGFSTLILALFFLDTISNPNTQTVVIAHDAETTKKLFDIVRRFYRNLPPDKQPRKEYYSRQEMSFPDLDSYIYVGTAGSGNYGRGGTPHNILGSEAAFWPRPEEIVSGLFESVPLDGNIFVESTANGVGGWYERTYNKSKDRETEYTARFFAWNIAPQNALEPPAEWTPSKDEAELAEAYGLNRAQLYWRHRKKTTLGILFEQEHPITDAEAFLTAGQPFFDRAALNVLYATMKKEPETFAPLSAAELAPLLDARAYPELFREALRGALEVWEPPIPGVLYSAGADVAEGEEENEDRDFDVVEIVRADTLEQVARLRGQWPTADYGILLAQLGFWYNEALLAVERNNQGLSVLNTLQNGRAGYEQWVYPIRRAGAGGLYYMEDLEERTSIAAQIRKAKRAGAQVVKKPGWHTNVKSRPLMLNHLDATLREALVALNSVETVRELMTFVKKAGGKAEGAGNSHDDSVMALGIAVYLAGTLAVAPEGDEGALNDERGFTASGGSRELANLFGGEGGED